MAAWRKNKLRRDIIERHGQETGLPLFEQPGAARVEKPAPRHVAEQLSAAPKSIEVATETRDVSHKIVTHDELNLGDKQQKVLDTLYLRDDWTFQELANYLGWSVNRVVPRVFELRQLGFVVAGEKRACSVTGYPATPWRVK